MSKSIVEVENLKKYFPITGGVLGRTFSYVKAVDDVSFQIKRGETLGLVGESGCGKTTLGRCLLLLLKITGGEVFFNTTLEESDSKKENFEERYNIIKMKNIKKLRRKMQIVHQDPFDSLDPRMLIRDIVAEPLVTHKAVKGGALRQRVIELLKQVGLTEEHLYRYPHELSGGQLQRVCIARAIALNPEFIVLDEPTSSLDVSVQAQILNLLKVLQNELGLSYLFISHDISVIDHMAERIAVMYLGKIVEMARKDELMQEPLHPYTIALLSSIPTTDPKNKMLDKVIFLEGDVPSPIEPPLGCRFHTRCPKAFKKCGWEARDLINYLQVKLENIDMNNLTFKPMGFMLEIVIENGNISEIQNVILEFIEKEKKDGNALFESINEVKKKENRINIRFIESQEPPLLEVKKEHQVACLLYKD